MMCGKHCTCHFCHASHIHIVIDLQKAVAGTTLEVIEVASEEKAEVRVGTNGLSVALIY